MNIVQQLKEFAILTIFSISIPAVIHFACNSFFSLPSEERYSELYNVLSDQEDCSYITEDEQKIFLEQKQELTAIKKKYEQELSRRRRMLFIPLLALSLLLIVIAVFLQEPLLRTGFLFSGIFLSASTLISSSTSVAVPVAIGALFGWLILLGIILYCIQVHKL